MTAGCQKLVLLARAVLVMLESIILDRRPDEGPKICNMINHLLVNQLLKVDHIGTHIVSTLPIIGEDVPDDQVINAPVSEIGENEISKNISPAAVEFDADDDDEAVQKPSSTASSPKSKTSSSATSNWKPDLLTDNSDVHFSPETMRWLFDGWNPDEAGRVTVDASSFCGPIILGHERLSTSSAHIDTNSSQLAHGSGFEQMQQSIQANFTQSMPDYSDSAQGGGSIIS